MFSSSQPEDEECKEGFVHFEDPLMGDMADVLNDLKAFEQQAKLEALLNSLRNTTDELQKVDLFL